ncbi:MAG: hypothetical protein ABIH34_05950 [Nanoarchaeota archaeon]
MPSKHVSETEISIGHVVLGFLEAQDISSMRNLLEEKGVADTTLTFTGSDEQYKRTGDKHLLRGSHHGDRVVVHFDYQTPSQKAFPHQSSQQTSITFKVPEALEGDVQEILARTFGDPSYRESPGFDPCKHF